METQLNWKLLGRIGLLTKAQPSTRFRIKALAVNLIVLAAIVFLAGRIVSNPF
jgi:hypothetical protein